MDDQEGVRTTSAFGAVLRRLRIAAGLSQEALAERARMSTAGIGALERGDRQTPQHETLEHLVRALALDPEQREAFEAAAARPSLLRSGDGRASSIADVPVDKSPVRNNLPRQLTSFVGRDEVVAEVAAFIEHSPLTTLVGSGGIGKTRTALEVGAHLLASFEEGVWFIELAPLLSGEYIATTIGKAMHLTLSSAGDPMISLLSALKGKHALLIFDNCEHLVEPAGRVIAELVRGCAQIRIMATTRQRLGLSGEAIYRIPSLSMPEADTQLLAADVGQYPAMTLFVERAAAIDFHFLITDENAPVIGNICRRLDGIPLAIELAAARVAMLGPRQLRDRLDDRFRLLTVGSRDLLPRHQTLHAMIDWSHDLLDDHERALFRRLGVFVNGFTFDSAIAVSNVEGLDVFSAFDVLASLVDKSLVLAESDGDAVRYRMLESTRAYAREKLVAAGELFVSVTRHLRHLRDAFAAVRKRAEHDGRSALIDDLLLTELEDVRLALDSVVGSADPGTGAELLAAIDDRWMSIDLGYEGSARLERFISLLPANESGMASRLWAALAPMAHRINRFRSLEAASTAVELARSANDFDALALALHRHGHLLGLSRSFEAAVAALRESDDLAPEENRLLRLHITDSKAYLGYLTGNYTYAAKTWEQLWKTHLLLGNLSEASKAVLSLAEVEHQRGNTEKAIMLAQNELAALRIGHNRGNLLGALTNLSGYLISRDRLSSARTAAREAIQAAPEHERSGVFVTCAIEHLALTIALESDIRHATRLAGYTEAIFQRIGAVREHNEQTTRTRLEALLAKRLEPDERESLLAAGAALSPEDAFALASL